MCIENAVAQRVQKVALPLAASLTKVSVFHTFFRSSDFIVVSRRQKDLLKNNCYSALVLKLLWCISLFDCTAVRI